ARISLVLHIASAKAPAVAENNKKGRINKPAARLIVRSVSHGKAFAAVNASISISTFLNTLSLKAPLAWVRKNGKNRLEAITSCCDIPTPLKNSVQNSCQHNQLR